MEKKEYYLYVKGKAAPVNEEVYKAYWKITEHGIEIDKAIKRGDKPSVIAQLKKFQEQEERKEQYKQKAKEKYTEQER